MPETRRPIASARRVSRLVLAIAAPAHLSGCAVARVADAAVTVGATAVKTGARAGGAAIDAALPDQAQDGSEPGGADDDDRRDRREP